MALARVIVKVAGRIRKAERTIRKFKKKGLRKGRIIKAQEFRKGKVFKKEFSENIKKLKLRKKRSKVIKVIKVDKRGALASGAIATGVVIGRASKRSRR